MLQLADEGVLHLDDSLYQWLDTMPYINPDITIRQLLQHTSGLFDLLGHPHQQDSLLADLSRIWTPEELIARFMAPPPAQPGATWAYCNTNYFLLSIIIKAATGHPFYTEIRSRFFTPLGLSTFAIPAFEPLNTPVAHVWLDINGDNISDDANDFYMNYMSLNSTVGAAGGYFSTPSDCTRWMRAYMRGDLLSAAMMAQAKTTVSAPGSQGNLYGLGLMKNDFLGYEAYGHGGDLAYHASSWYFPELDASITVFTNDNNCNSWALLPVVRELLRTYTLYAATTVTSPSGLAQHTAMEIYPNPFTDQLSVRFRSAGTGQKEVLLLQDITGKTIRSQQGKQGKNGYSTAVFNGLDHLSPGTYFVSHYIHGSRSATVKVIR